VITQRIWASLARGRRCRPWHVARPRAALEVPAGSKEAYGDSDQMNGLKSPRPKSPERIRVQDYLDVTDPNFHPPAL